MKKETRKFFSALTLPAILVAVMWAVHAYAEFGHVYLNNWGLYPRELFGFRGIVTGIFIHADWKHLFNNSIPLIILGWGLYYSYREVALKVFLWVLLMGGFWTWISAREAYHIGASGLVYGLFAFVLFSGFIRRNKQLLALSFLVAFLYGSLVWGLLPIDYKMSWESHFWGFLAGFLLAVYYRKIGKQKEKHHWDEREERLLDDMDFWKDEAERKNDDPPFKIIYKPKDSSSQS